MKLFERDPFGYILFIKKWLIRILGIISHRRFRGINHLIIEGSEIKNKEALVNPEVLEQYKNIKELNY